MKLLIGRLEARHDCRQRHSGEDVTSPSQRGGQGQRRQQRDPRRPRERRRKKYEELVLAIIFIAIRRLLSPYLRRRPPTSYRAFIALHSLALRRPPTALVPCRRPPPLSSRRPSPSLSWLSPSSVGGDSSIAVSVGVAPAAGKDPTIPTRRRRRPSPCSRIVHRPPRRVTSSAARLGH